MPANDSLRMMPLPVRSIAAAAILVGYSAIGTASTDSSRMLLIQNLTDAGVMISHNGVDDHYPIAAQTSIIFDLTTNRTADVNGYYIAQNTTIYCKRLSGAAATGSVYVTFIVGQNSNG